MPEVLKVLTVLVPEVSAVLTVLVPEVLTVLVLRAQTCRCYVTVRGC